MISGGGGGHYSDKIAFGPLEIANNSFCVSSTSDFLLQFFLTVLELIKWIKDGCHVSIFDWSGAIADNNL
jgi:hypothetical protein